MMTMHGSFPKLLTRIANGLSSLGQCRINAVESSSLDVRRAGANLLPAPGEAGKELALNALEDNDGVVQKRRQEPSSSLMRQVLQSV